MRDRRAKISESALAERDRRIVLHTGALTLGTLAATSGYAVLRYALVGPVPFSQLPVYLLNKSIAWSSLTLVCIALSTGALSRIAPGLFAGWVRQRKFIGLSGFMLATVHLVMSLSILTPAYYPSFFDGPSSTFNLLGVLTVQSGVVSWMLLFTLMLVSIPSVQQSMSRQYWLRWQRGAGLGAALLGGGHVLYGFAGWWTPETWHGGLPPITLLSFLLVVLMLTIRWVARRFENSG